jgi:opacity protein-like surface antigen
MMMKRMTLVVLVLGAFALTPSRSQAQVNKGDFRLSLDTRLLGFIASTNETNDDNDVDVKERRLDVGLGSPELGIGVGYTVIDGLVVGARLATAFATTKTDPEHDNNNQKLHEFGFQLMPYVEYAFNLGRFTPFVMATLGYRNEFSKTIYYENQGDPSDKLVTNAFVFAGGGGLHFFLVDALSIDLTATIGGEVGGHTWENDPGAGDTATHDYGYRAFAAKVLLGLSGWL